MTPDLVVAVSLAGLAVAAVVLALAAVRVRARRSARGMLIKVVGDQPELMDWLTPILDDVAGHDPPVWEWTSYPASLGDDRLATRVELRNPTRDTQLDLVVTSSKPAACSTRPTRCWRRSGWRPPRRPGPGSEV